MLKPILKWMITGILLLGSLFTLLSAFPVGDWNNCWWSVVMMLAGLGIVFSWSWAQYAYYLLAYDAVTGWLGMYAFMWNSGELHGTVGRSVEEILYGGCIIAFFVISSLFVHSIFKGTSKGAGIERESPPRATGEPASGAGSGTRLKFSFSDIVSGVFFSALLAATYFLLPAIMRQSISLISTVLDNLGFPSTGPIVAVGIFITLILILVLSRVVESGFSLQKLFRSKNKDVISR